MARLGPIRKPSCWICGKQVTLNNCKTDENGHAVHEACYVASIKTEDGSQSTIKNRGFATGT